MENGKQCHGSGRCLYKIQAEITKYCLGNTLADIAWYLQPVQSVIVNIKWQIGNRSLLGNDIGLYHGSVLANQDDINFNPNIMKYNPALV